MSKKKKQERKEHRKEERKKRGGKSKVGAFLKKVKDKAKHLGQDAPFAVLLPFKKIMKNKLDKNNISHDNSLKDIAIQFAKHVHEFSHFECLEIDALHADATSAGIVAGGLANAGASVATGNYTGAVKAIIQAIVNFFKHLKEKKTSGEKLTKDETQMLDQAEKVSDEIEDAVKDEVQGTIAERIRDFIFSWKGALALVALLALVYFAFFYK